MPKAKTKRSTTPAGVEITRPDKILFPNDGITKRELVDYYTRIAPSILPHLRGRPLMLERYPDGIGGSRIFQKAAPRYFPEWIKTATVKKAGGTVRHVICEDAATLAYLANQACITPHIWLSRAENIDHPDQMVFDLDPSGDDFAPVKETAQALRELLKELHLPAYVKTSGSRGLHVIVPLKPGPDFDAVRGVARHIAEIAVRQDPRHRTLEIRKMARRGRVFIDTNRNGYAQTVAPAYAVRTLGGAPVSVPLDWRELDQKNLRPDQITIKRLFTRLEKTADPWKHFWKDAAGLDTALDTASREETRHAA